jgi:hypothetical protein
MMKIVAIMVATFFVAGVSGASAAPSPTLVFVLAGQSNMVGHGYPVVNAKPADSIVAWNNGWVDAQNPLAAEGMSPGLPFARYVLSQRPSERIGLVMCAEDGSPVSRWREGGDLLSTCISKTRSALGTGGRLGGVLFMQGETESMSADLAPTWLAGFQSFTTTIRAALGFVPVVFGQIGAITDPRCVYQAQVRTEQTQARDTAHKTRMVTTLDLPLLPDGIHFTAHSAGRLGQRFARAWLLTTT